MLQERVNEALEKVAAAVAIAMDAETAARASIGQKPYITDRHRAIAVAALKAMLEPTDDMVSVGEQWRSHCSDTDSLFTQMMLVAIHGR